MIVDAMKRADDCFFGTVDCQMSELRSGLAISDRLWLVLCLRGSACFRVAGQAVDVAPGAMLLFTSSQLQEQCQIQPDFQASILAIPRDYFDLLGHEQRTAVMVDLEIGGNPLAFLAAPDFSLALSLFQQLYRLDDTELPVDNKKRLAKCVVESLFEVFCARRSLGKCDSQSMFTGLVGRFMALLLHNYRQHRFVGYYAERLQVSPKYLSWLILERTGLEASRWIARFILAEARHLLMTSNLEVKQIARELHFVDASTFDKYFRRSMGCTPLQYRLQNAN